MLRSLTALTSVAVLLPACALGPDHSPPEVELPQAWPEHVLLSEADRQAWGRWWTRYGDAQLDALVARALDDNLDLRLQLQRVAEARARLGLADANRLPTVDAQAEAQRSRQSAAQLGLDDEFADLLGTRNLFALTGVLGYEVDLWGRLAREREAAGALLQQSVFTHEAVRLGVIADVVATYVGLRAAQEQLQITERTLESRERTRDLERIRHERGATDALALAQTVTELETTRARLPALREQVQALTGALASLVGMSPDELFDEPDFGDLRLADLQLPDALPDELPSTLLQRRPDLRAAEAELIAANAGIGIAQAQRLPRVNLSAFLGTAATEPGDLFSSAAETWGVGASVAGPVLDFGRSRAGVQTAEALRDQAETRYRMTVQTAFREVRDALVAYDAADERVAAIRRQVDAVSETRDLAQRRHDAGYIGFIELLDAERTLLDAEVALSEAVRDRLNATATLFKAMGGGWDPDGAVAAAARP